MKNNISTTIVVAAAYALLHGVAIDTNINYRQRSAGLAKIEGSRESIAVAVSSSDTLPIVADAAALRYIVFDRSRGKLNLDLYPDPMHPVLALALSAGALLLAAWMVVGIVRAAVDDYAAIAYAARSAAPAYLVGMVALLAVCCALGNMPASVRLVLWDAAGRHAVATLGTISSAVALAAVRIAIYRAAAMLCAAKAAATREPSFEMV